MFSKTIFKYKSKTQHNENKYFNTKANARIV